jgi:hypothetical protein
MWWWGENKVVMPCGYHIIHVDVQYGHITAWAEVDTNNDMEPVTFLVVPTGDEIPNNVEHVATILTENGNLVSHVYRTVSPIEMICKAL